MRLRRQLQLSGSGSNGRGHSSKVLKAAEYWNEGKRRPRPAKGSKSFQLADRVVHHRPPALPQTMLGLFGEEMDCARNTVVEMSPARTCESERGGVKDQNGTNRRETQTDRTVSTSC